MIYVNTNSKNVFYNFGAEMYFADKKNLGDTVFLFWQTSPTLMCGKYQNPFEEIDMAYAREKNITLVRRASGGGTIYTDEGGWQFSFIDKRANTDISFTEYMKPVIDALIKLGVPAEMSGRNDILAAGRKFSGNAQYKTDNATVHHGSLLFSTDIEEIVRATTVDEYKFTSKSIKSVKDRVVNLCEFRNGDMNSEQFGEYMVKEILKSGSKYFITEEDDREIKKLAKEYFENPERIYGLTPRFTVRKKGRFTGGTVAVELEVKKGKIVSLNLTGDFFSSKEVAYITQEMAGCPYEAQAVKENFSSLSDGAFYNITDEEIAKLIAE